ncbi:MAG: RIP metalloprotease RseP [Gammaproteobacteria bacterium]|nr:RIP metalloprotease RseP [Gammaproteobacteria bacterium]MCW8909041.1 RIP metalloprotease RseP [Gammaproteobacteria bacterium]MCW9004764.1 RIP metalloprotease RseP [Gammaproteobacteria bacterium]MCW9055043.1 RIP metalloprotease RseP [Gammaproteobacteria bacterium]
MPLLDLLHNVIFFILAIGVLVTFHEFGHYWVARSLGVKVLRFSVGFGKPIYTWRKTKGNDEIEYVIAMIPLGGYVKMLDEREADVDDSEKARAFNRQPILNRIAIVAAGPIFNFLLAIALYWIVFINGVDGLKPVIGQPVDQSIAAQAGFVDEDEIFSVGSTEVNTWQSFRMALIDYGIDGGSLKIKVKTADQMMVERELLIGDKHILDSDADVIQQLGFKRWNPEIPAVFGGVTDTGAARKAGLKKGDLILAVDGETINNWEHLVEIVKSSAGSQLEFLVRRDNSELFINVTPLERKINNLVTGFIGAYPAIPAEVEQKTKTHIEYTVGYAFIKSIEKTWNMSILTLRVLGKMLLGEAALENISGPITIASYAGITASIGIITYLSFLAMISVSLGVLNLLPIPMLDGGHLFYYLIEFIKGSPVSEKFEEIGQQIGLTLLLMLMALAVFNDIQRLIN